tara:strand:- start:106 stop:519 length:414 start_codon:yes stop_codon:yes gene_type:complete
MMNNFLKIFNLPKGIKKKFVILGLAVFFIYFGIDHFINPEFYLSIMPESFPLHDEAVYISGFFEILGGFGVLVERLRKFAGWGLIALLISVYPANIYMALNPELFSEYSISLLYFRLVLQFLFFYWAYTVTLPAYNK